MDEGNGDFGSLSIGEERGGWVRLWGGNGRVDEGIGDPTFGEESGGW